MAIPKHNPVDGTDVSSYRNPDGSLTARFDTYGRRRVGTTTAPTVAAGAGAGSGATASLAAGTDEHGTVRVVTAGTPAAGTLVTVTFNQPYATTPATVRLAAGDASSAAAQLYATVSTTALTIKYAGTLAASQTLAIYYSVVGGK